MSENKRKNEGQDRSKKRFHSNGTPIWGQRTIDGPGIWVSCVKGKEKQTIGELYDLFESLSSTIWPATGTNSKDPEEDDLGDDLEDDEDLEKQIAKEVASMKRPRTEKRFANCPTNTPCVVFISTKAPVDPVKLVLRHIENVMETGVTRTRFTHRLTPVLASCATNLQEIQSLCKRLIDPLLSEEAESHTYKIELRIRNHSTLKRPVVLQELAKCVPEKHKVDLENPEVFILVEMFKSVCGISVVKDYYRLQKFNVMELGNAKKEDVDFQEGEGRL